MRAYFQMFAGYNAWANHRVHAACALLDAGGRRRDGDPAAVGRPGSHLQPPDPPPRAGPWPAQPGRDRPAVPRPARLPEGERARVHRVQDMQRAVEFRTGVLAPAEIVW